ncbi:tryptophan 7-halogenase [Proteobacteria bacterium 005FR1]|nr:tryptophan 7-halogenase [Proteobacteria bacterium 005FR1]
MNNTVKRIIVVGGGSAGWLTAGLLAAEHLSADQTGIEVILIESPDVTPIGVGEGTWPSMRSTLHAMGISETDFIRECEASFKQGTLFSNWTTGEFDRYYHPFSLPQGYQDTNLAFAWQDVRDKVSFADAVSPQSQVCARGLAPKQITTPEFAFNLNYGYHLDAGKFAGFLQRHCVEKLGVRHIRDHVVEVNEDSHGYISSLSTEANGPLAGDLFIDCTGFSSLLLGRHYGVPFISQRHVLFNDSALAVQVPYPEADSPIASCTLSTAQTAGWIWDIGLPSRRGVGHVYSSDHCSDEHAEAQLRAYIEPALGRETTEKLVLRKIAINPGYRERFWHRNCVAIGLSAGFLEPLEASALVLVELSAKMVSDQLPANREAMAVVAGRFNRKFKHHWERIIDFLKLHYILTQRRDSAYWRDNCSAASIPESLQELTSIWRYQGPWHYDATLADEMFPPASLQYVAYGMGLKTEPQQSHARSRARTRAQAGKLFQENAARTRQLLSMLPTNRELISKIKRHGLATI